MSTIVWVESTPLDVSHLYCEMSVPSVSVMLNRKPYYYAVAIDPVSATVHGLIASVRSLVAEEHMESTVRLRWIVHEVSPWVFE